MSYLPKNLYLSNEGSYRSKNIRYDILYITDEAVKAAMVDGRTADRQTGAGIYADKRHYHSNRA